MNIGSAVRSFDPGKLRDMETLEVIVDGNEAELMRDFLRPWRVLGVTSTDSRHWIIWRRFLVEAPSHVISDLHRSAQNWQDERWRVRNGF